MRVYICCSSGNASPIKISIRGRPVRIFSKRITTNSKGILQV